MRQILSISLPQRATKEVKTLAVRRGFRSVSSYVEYLIGLDKDLISEEELLAAAQRARKEYRAGTTITARSLADLL